jgi:glycosyltransferase involved in cell wall biosynthesis
MKPAVSLIVSTYNQPEWLEKALWGYEQQTFTDFEILIADDGSTADTAKLIEKYSRLSTRPIKHLWQEDNGFQKNKILNKAIQASAADYLIMTDGDCIPRNDFVEKHIALRRKKHFLSGGYFKLPIHLSKTITREDINSQSCFKLKWLQERGLKKTFKTHKLTSSGFKEWFLNKFTTTKATWDGNNASGWKEDILSINGFDERMQYGGEDREMGERLVNYGITPLQIRYSAITLHLHHERNYVKPTMLAANRQIRYTTRHQRLTYTPYGIVKPIISAQ